MWSAWGAPIPPPFKDQIFARKQVADYGKASQRGAKDGVFGPRTSKRRPQRAQIGSNELTNLCIERKKNVPDFLLKKMPIRGETPLREIDSL